MWATEDSDVILIFMKVISLSSIKFCLSIYGAFLFWGYFRIYLLQKVLYFLCKLCLFLCFIFLTTLKYHSNKFLELKPKDEVTSAVTWCLILAYFRML